MYNLLKAGIFKLRKNKVFLGMIVVSFFIAGLVLFLQASNRIMYDTDSLEKVIVDNTNILGFVIAVFVSLFTGIEYSERSN